MIVYPEAPFTFRRKGLPKRMKRIPGGVPGLRAACNIHVGKDGDPVAKVVFFKDRLSMRRFWKDILPAYRGAEEVEVRCLGRRCAGCVHALAVENFDLKENKVGSIEIDRRYFCIVCLVEGDLTAEFLAHEAAHVGFAWDYRHRGNGMFRDPHNFEENVCYPAGRFVDQVLTFIKAEGLREV